MADLPKSKVILFISTEAKHTLTGIEVAVKILNKKKMKNKNMISKVHLLSVRSKNKSESSNLLIIPTSSNSMKSLIQPQISSSLWNLPPRENSTKIFKTIQLMKPELASTSSKSLMEFSISIKIISLTEILNHRIFSLMKMTSSKLEISASLI